MLIEIIIFLITALIVFFLYSHYNVHKSFERRGLKYLPGYPVLGNAKSTLATQHMFHDLDEVYNAFPGERYVGYIEGITPIILVRDPELIKQLNVKDFDHFMDHKQFFPEEVEPLLGASVLSMTGERWRVMRNTLSPAFTNSKMRRMMPFMTEISNNIVENLKENLRSDEHLDVTDLVCRYTTDVIASAAFGFQVNSLKDKNNEFLKLSQEIFDFNTWQRIAFFLSGQSPKLTKSLNLSILPKRTTKFFRDLVTSTMEYREKNNVDRPDMIQLLMQASKDWTPDELVSQVVVFFVAGSETATALTMTFHELALNPEIEEKLYQEIKKFKETHEELTYDNINELKYMDCVLNETMRKWAIALILDRVCTKPYELPPPRAGGKPVRLKRGDIVYNVVNSIHMDPQYFPEPHKFNPDRFSDENKHNIKPFTYMPFGMGPRGCIGSRFAILEIKILLYNMLLNFKVLRGPKTADPIVLDTSSFSIKSVGGTHVKLENRK